MSQDTGYEHYFMHYYLYLPYSRNSVYQTHKKALYYMKTHNFITSYKDEVDHKHIYLSNASNKLTNEDLKKLIVEYKTVCKSLSNIQKLDKIKLYALFKDLDLNEFDDLEISQELRSLSSTSTNTNHSDVSNNSITIDNSNKRDYYYNLALQRIIYGDFFENKNIEVNLQQRKTQKVKYKKITFSEQHRFDDELENLLNKFIDEQLGNEENLIKMMKEENKTYVSNTVNGIQQKQIYQINLNKKKNICHNELLNLRKQYEKI